MMFEGFFDLTKPVGLAETCVSIIVFLFVMWLSFVWLKLLKNKRSEDE